MALFPEPFGPLYDVYLAAKHSLPLVGLDKIRGQFVNFFLGNSMAKGNTSKYFDSSHNVASIAGQSSTIQPPSARRSSLWS